MFLPYRSFHHLKHSLVSTHPTSQKYIMSSTTPNIYAGDQITLQVGTQRFITTARTLTSKSDFFKRFLSPRWAKPEKDGSYLLDADPVLFGHILQYLRRNAFPIFYDEVKGHDKAMYVALQQEADYFALKSLMEWLKEKKYLQVVQTQYTVHEIGSGLPGRFPAGVKYEFYPKWSMEKVYLCPSGADGHNGHPRFCHEGCTDIREELGQQWGERHVFGGVILTYETIFNEDLCVDRS
ncbi:hypothetical protein OCU04_003236 [Sclerotinia nivalis]|uniref:BTB domain-containing protein n=1 Tax=Sclerotinia nivalis TaxID=352851 RepID=A0A9X0ARI0_9HELO|nr:hypothetical protein OCU04_003236 [Sclerotinia nivalis]